jgi:hypothetical protein
MRAGVRRTAVPLVLLAIAACGATHPPPAAPPRYACPRVAIPAVNGGKPGGPCQTDADCKDHPDGRCVTILAPSHTAPVVQCLYDACASDADCARGSICECGTGQGTSRNRCIPGNCHANVDCGDWACTETMSTFVAGNDARRVEGRFCKTREDQCRVDRDCDLEGRSACAYRKELSRWTCVAISYGPPD